MGRMRRWIERRLAGRALSSIEGPKPASPRGIGSHEAPAAYGRRLDPGPDAAALASARANAPARPNVVFILTDDLGWTDLGCYGSTFTRRRTSTGWRRRGMRFNDAYAACPVCSPTRASILTGKYPARLHITDWIPGRKTPDAEAEACPDWTRVSPRGSHPRRGAQAGGLRHGQHRQVAPRRPEHSGPSSRAST